MDTGQWCEKSSADQQQKHTYTKHYCNQSPMENLRGSSISSHGSSQSINKRSSHYIFPSWRPSHHDCHVTHGGAGWTTTTYLVILLALVSVNTISGQNPTINSSYIYQEGTDITLNCSTQSSSDVTLNWSWSYSPTYYTIENGTFSTG
ncbi:hypothetical protein BgiBS90_023731, partial [Biomphalaria glabrata]|uniref:Ig-like domain-containing protein n=1 Tax=Biomphalaria glabrata TaxID=6526 RepID=A0A2C9KQZ8_BIOGL